MPPTLLRRDSERAVLLRIFCLTENFQWLLLEIESAFYKSRTRKSHNQLSKVSPDLSRHLSAQSKQ